MDTAPDTRTGFSWWYILLDLILWSSFILMHRNERWFHTAIPMWVHMPLWSALLGGAIGGLTGRLKPMLTGLVIAGVILPIAIVVLFSLASVGR